MHWSSQVDKYAKSVVRLRTQLEGHPDCTLLRRRARQELVLGLWKRGTELFAPLSPSGETETPNGLPCGCATMVKHGTHVAWTVELTEFVRSLPLPSDPTAIFVEHLPLFAAVQRKADELIPDRT